MYYNKKRKAIFLHRDRDHDFMSIDGYDYELAFLETGPPGGKGGNSSVFRAIPGADTGDELVVKISKYAVNTEVPWEQQRNERFEREITALKKAKNASLHSSVVKIVLDGTLKLKMDNTEVDQQHRYFVMEKADGDLKQFLDNESLGLLSKIDLCSKIFDTIHRLHQIDIYHRDIKPDNILMFDEGWKIGDLGLVAYRNEDSEIERKEKRIGPWGFLSPEAVNRYWATSNSPTFGELCSIDYKSDYYQIGLLFWYILQAEVPIGQLDHNDLRIEEHGQKIYEEVIAPLLQFNKERRPTYDDVSGKLKALTI